MGEFAGGRPRRNHHPPQARHGGSWRFAREFACPPYDGAYLELAVRRGAALATLEGKLAKAACTAGSCAFLRAVAGRTITRDKGHYHVRWAERLRNYVRPATHQLLSYASGSLY
jgi:hypothetical protein